MFILWIKSVRVHAPTTLTDKEAMTYNETIDGLWDLLVAAFEIEVKRLNDTLKVE